MRVQEKKIQTQNSVSLNLNTKSKEQLSPEVIYVFNKIVEERNLFNNYIRSSFIRGNRVDYDFSHFSKIGDLFDRIYKGKTLITEAEREQENLEFEFEKLKKYKPRENSVYCQLREDLYENIKHLKKGREMIIKSFMDKLFLLSDPKFYPQYREDSSGSEENNNELDGSPRNGGEGPSGNNRPPRNGDDSDSSGGGEGPSGNNIPSRNNRPQRK